MSYTPSHQSARKVAKAVALTVIEHTTNTTQTISAGNRIEIGTVHNWYGSFSPTIATNQITLTSGYYYYIESMVNAYMAGSHNLSSYVSYQHYNETDATDIGTLATIFATYNEDNQLFSRDGCARVLIDCTSAAKNISLKVSAEVGNFDRLNYSGGSQPFSGYGRTVIWQLNSN